MENENFRGVSGLHVTLRASPFHLLSFEDCFLFSPEKSKFVLH
jgi:hypothetical protein